jgi:hypothetical protein
MIQMPEIATAQQLADYLHISLQVVHNYSASERFTPGIKIGKGKFNFDALKNAIENPPYRYLIECDAKKLNSNLTMVKQRRAANKREQK